MFYFYSDKKGVLRQNRSGVMLKAKRLFPDLRSARAKTHVRILVVDAESIPEPPTGTRVGNVSLHESLELNETKHLVVPIEAIRNISPYQSPLEIAAGGGVITRLKDGKLQVLLIRRKGMWELPKGKRDRGETMESCAVREVREELGISNIEVVRPLDVTIHAYSENRRLKVKTTHWFQMTTDARKFKPEKREGITEVKWFAWKKAQKAVPYRNLRELLERLRPLVAEAH